METATENKPVETESLPRECICRDCGKKFKYGTEGDNEKFCLRCERIFLNNIRPDWN